MSKTIYTVDVHYDELDKELCCTYKRTQTIPGNGATSIIKGTFSFNYDIYITYHCNTECYDEFTDYDIGRVIDIVRFDRFDKGRFKINAKW